mmetsp:Transcript_87816/g.183566  ORF Transcript_87816/g.183566 Transcript_87816/m.183566 type:complete len:322 (-) Transcript_87816:138-1103(-)
MSSISDQYKAHHFDASKWKVVDHRPGDIIIATWGKSGTTWMQAIVAELVFWGKEKPGPIGMISPWIDVRLPPAEVIESMIKPQEHRRFLKTHLPFDALEPYFNPQGKYIYVGRDGLDAFMSMQNHYEKANDAWYESVNETPGRVGPPIPRYEDAVADGGISGWFAKFLTTGWDSLPESDGWPFWSLFKNTKTWWEFGQANPERVLFVHFNNMLEDLPREIKRIGDFLGIDVTDEMAAKITEVTSFSSMKQNAAAVAPAGGAAWKGGAADFIFKGTNGRWKGVLTDENVQAYEAKVKEEFSPECAHWLHTGELPSSSSSPSA